MKSYESKELAIAEIERTIPRLVIKAVRRARRRRSRTAKMRLPARMPRNNRWRKADQALKIALRDTAFEHNDDGDYEVVLTFDYRVNDFDGLKVNILSPPR